MRSRASIEDALRRNGIPYVIIGGVAFYKRKEIKDVLAYLKLLANPKDDESLLRVINVPARAIGDTSIKRIRSVAASERVTMMEALASKSLEGLLQDRALRAVRQFHAMLGKYIGLKGQMSRERTRAGPCRRDGILRILKEENTPESTARRRQRA